MPIIFKGTTLNSITFKGKQLSRVYYNDNNGSGDVLVFEKPLSATETLSYGATIKNVTQVGDTYNYYDRIYTLSHTPAKVTSLSGGSIENKNYSFTIDSDGLSGTIKAWQRTDSLTGLQQNVTLYWKVSGNKFIIDNTSTTSTSTSYNVTTPIKVTYSYY